MNDDSAAEPRKGEVGDGQAGGKTAGKRDQGKVAKKGRKLRKTAATPAIREIERRIGYEFADSTLLVSALTHVSALSPTARAASYQRLEFLGDHVLGLAVSDMLYRAFPKADEGELSRRLAALVRWETCADVAQTLELADAVKLGAVGNAGERLRKAVLGDICEAVIGAIYIDGGYGAAAKFVERTWRERLSTPMRPPRDPKTVLQEWAQGRGLPTPTYREVERTGPHHDPRFRIEVALPGLKPSEGVGASKRAAEMAAASELLLREGVADESDG